MHISFTSTLDEYREANAANNKARRKRRALISRLILFTGAGAAGGLLAASPASGRDNAAFTLVLGELSIAAPFLLLLITFLTLSIVRSRAQWNPPRNFITTVAPRIKRGWLNLLGWLFLLAILTAVSALSSRDQVDDTDGAVSWVLNLAPRLPWILMLIILVVFSICASAGAIRLIWRGSPNDRRQQEVEISSERIVFATAVRTIEYQWDAILCFGETANMFLLYNSVASFHLIPKRAFLDEAQLTAFRNILQNQVVPKALED